MKKIAYLLFAISSLDASAQKGDVIDLGQLQNLLNEKNEKILIVNFWATWCGPCVKEMPFFEKITAEGKEHIEVLLVSMDLDLDPDAEKVYRFIERKKIQSRVVLLSAPNPDSWISKVEKSWTGALPATIVINQKTGQRKFVGKSLHEGDLERLIADVQ